MTEFNDKSVADRDTLAAIMAIKKNEDDYLIANAYRDINLDPVEVANQAGLTIVLPAPDELFIDIDSLEEYRHFEIMLGAFNIVQDYYYAEVVSDKLSKSGYPKHHVIVGIYPTIRREGYPAANPVKENPWCKLALQAILGSDPKRELLNSLRQLMNGDSKNCFFEKAVK